MRLTLVTRDAKTVAAVALSRRNLPALLHKLDMPDSRRTLESLDCPDGWLLSVISEDDEQHYQRRGWPPPGVMHPQTEDAIARPRPPVDES